MLPPEEIANRLREKEDRKMSHDLVKFDDFGFCFLVIPFLKPKITPVCPFYINFLKILGARNNQRQRS